MSTYSYGTPPTDATNLNNIVSVLNQLPDNTSKQITPKDVRDAIFTNWENIIIKPTSITSGQGYIGLDNGVNGLTYSKFYFGKRRYLGNDVMTSTLLNSTTDFFFFNNKVDTISSQPTRISILSGTDSSIMSLAPYIESRHFSGMSYSYMDLYITNDSTDSNGLYGGNIVIGTTQSSDWLEGGNVIINGMAFPRYIEPFSDEANAINGNVLKYNSSGFLSWESSAGTIDSITSSGTVSISGSPVLINNQQTNFLTDATPMILPVGSIPAGYTFSNENIVEVVRKMLYPYLPPQISYVLNVTPVSGSNPSTYQTSGSPNVVIEMNNLGSFNYTVTLTKRSLPIISYTSALPSANLSLFTPQTLTIANSLAQPGNFGTVNFNVTIFDGTQSVSQSSSITKVLPFFFGTSTNIVTPANFATIAGALTKRVITKSQWMSNPDVSLSGQNVCIYFAYPAIHGDLSSIKDANNFEALGSFTKSDINLSSPSGYWSGQTYRIYVWTLGSGTPTAIPAIGQPPTYTSPVTWKFIF